MVGPALASKGELCAAQRPGYYEHLSWHRPLCMVITCPASRLSHSLQLRHSRSPLFPASHLSERTLRCGVCEQYRHPKHRPSDSGAPTGVRNSCPVPPTVPSILLSTGARLAPMKAQQAPYVSLCFVVFINVRKRGREGKCFPHTPVGDSGAPHAQPLLRPL